MASDLCADPSRNPLGSRKSLRPSARSSPRASTNAARDQGYASPAFRNRNRQKPRKLLPSIAPGAPSTGVVGTPLTCYRGKQATAEWKRAKAAHGGVPSIFRFFHPTPASRKPSTAAPACAAKPLQFLPRPSSTGQLPISACGSLSLFQRARHVVLNGLTTSRRSADSA